MKEELEGLLEQFPEMYLLDGLEPALVGVCHSMNQDPAAVYDQGKILELLQQQGMDETEAQEYFEFNILGLYPGSEGTPPLFLLTQ